MISAVSSDTVDTHEILTTLLLVLFKSCIVVTLAAVESHIPFGVAKNGDIEEVSSTLTLWLRFKLETLFTNKIHDKSLMIFICNKKLTMLGAYHFIRNKSCCDGYNYIKQ